jgi:hypothetical protein
MHRWPLILLCPLLAGCTGGRAQPDLPVQAGVIASYPFAPTGLRVHPLTHIDPGWEREGQSPANAQLVLHFELLDRYGDSVKGLGTVHVEVYRPGAAVPGTETQDLAWDVDGMNTPEANTRRFDMATRTYRIPLVAPTWIAESAQKGYIRVKVTMRTAGPDGELVLQDEFAIQG